MKPGRIYRNTRTGSDILVVSSEMVNLSDHPYCMGIRCLPEVGGDYPFSVGVAPGLVAHTMTLAPRLKSELELDDRVECTVTEQAMNDIMTALFRIMRQD